MQGPGVIGGKHTAFTLVELVIVVLVLGILAAAGAPRFAASLRYHRVESAARRVAADLRMAQRLARTASSDKTVSFDVGGDGYSIFPDVDDFDRPGQPYAVDLAAAPFAASVLSANFGGDSTVIFNGYGAPDSGGQVVVASGGERRTITVDGASGAVAIAEPMSVGPGAEQP